MALWGKADKIYSSGTITINGTNYANKTITGSGTSFTSASVGDVISVGAGGTLGEAVISAVTSNTVISVATTQYLSVNNISGASYTISQKPVYSLQDSNLSPNSPSSTTRVYGVDIAEVGVASTSRTKIAHGGWVATHTYTDADNNVRFKSEVLVAMSSISTGTAAYINAATATEEQKTDAAGDASDDSVFPDAP
jgi:hypothetical protein